MPSILISEEGFITNIVFTATLVVFYYTFIYVTWKCSVLLEVSTSSQFCTSSFAVFSMAVRHTVNRWSIPRSAGYPEKPVLSFRNIISVRTSCSMRINFYPHAVLQEDQPSQPYKSICESSNQKRKTHSNNLTLHLLPLQSPILSVNLYWRADFIQRYLPATGLGPE